MLTRFEVVVLKITWYTRLKNDKTSDKTSATINVTKNVTSDVITEAPKRVNELDFEVLHLLKENPIYTREEIAQKVGKTARTVQRALDRLKADGKIVRIGNKVSGYWEVIE